MFFNNVMLTELKKTEINCEGSAAPGQFTAHMLELSQQKTT